EKWFFQHPIHDLLDGFRFLAKITMRAERITRPRLRRAAARNGNKRILIRKRRRIAVGRNAALIADVMDEQNRNLDGCKVETAQPGSRFVRSRACCAEHG